MDDDEDMDVAAAMGFGSFGGTKKRKHDHTKSPRATDDASGANSTQLGVRPKKVASTYDAVPETSETSDSKGYLAAENLPISTNLDSAPRHQPRNDASVMETVSFGGPPITRGELNALKFGVRNEKGDTAYFLSNFVEDPWASLKKTRA